ncbi:ATP synthase subunit I [Sedimenticola selenatireducens]|uniref:ATP synthase subunit I n=1 Tax=Sedimenticola selenatireducens TaxID=191960 RepID=UPI0004B361C7|nr:ATP synthase subunit I [Sedimenticola selenatireducens]
MHLADKRQAYRTVLAQLVTTLTAALLLLMVAGDVYAYSGLAGGLIATLANAFFAFRIFVRYTAQEPGRLLARFYGAEILKLVLTGLLFAGAILWIKPLSVGALFGIFLLVQLMPIAVVQLLD